jgi:hypothetical protein
MFNMAHLPSWSGHVKQCELFVDYVILFIHECSLSLPLDAHISSYGPYGFFIFVEGQIELNNI